MDNNRVRILKPRIDAALAPESANPADRTVEMQFYSGAEVRRFSWGKGEYNLRMSMDPGHVRLGQLNSGRAPLLEGHSDSKTSDVLGVIEAGEIRGGKGYARARFAKNDPAADAVWNKVEQGILRNVSMGLQIHKLQETSKEEDKVKSYLAVDWEPLEISVVPIGADGDAQMLSAGRPAEIEVELLGRAISLKEQTMDSIDNAGDARAITTNATPPASPPADEQLNAARNVGITAEQARNVGIITVTRALGLPMSFAEQHIRDNTPLEAFRAIAIDRKAASVQDPLQQRSAVAEILTDETDTRRRNMSTALLYRWAPGKFYFDAEIKDVRFDINGSRRMDEGSRFYASCTLLDIAKECLTVQNIRWQSKSRTEIAQLAFMSTSDFPFILADVAGKSLRAGYEAVPAEWRSIAARRSAADFKIQKELTLDSSSRLELVPESGEFTRGALVDGKESWNLATYGKIIAITRQAIINDDLGAFTRTPMLLGQEVAMLEADTVYGIITTNPNMRDGNALFSAAHANEVTPGATIAVDELGKARKLMQVQTSPGGKYINPQPRYLLVPAALGQLAEQYTSANFVAAQASNINPMAGKLIPIIEPRLDAASTKKWYLFADPNTPNGTVLIYGYLDGQEGPYTETRNGFDVDGTEIKIRHDFAAAAIDTRGAVLDDGQ